MYTDSNNAVEYEALLHGLQMTVSMGIQCLEVCGDSDLAISQINGDFDAKDPKMAAYVNTVLNMSARFEGLEFHHIARENNQATDVLARIGAKRDAVPPPTFSWKGYSSHPYSGKGNPELTNRTRPHHLTQNTITQRKTPSMKSHPQPT